MGSEALRFEIGHTYNLHNGHEYFTVVAVSAQFVTLQRVASAGWGDKRIDLCGREFRPFRRKIRHDFYKRGVDSVTFGYNTEFADEEVPPGRPLVPRLVRPWREIVERAIARPGRLIACQRSKIGPISGGITPVFSASVRDGDDTSRWIAEQLLVFRGITQIKLLQCHN